MTLRQRRSAAQDVYPEPRRIQPATRRGVPRLPDGAHGYACFRRAINANTRGTGELDRLAEKSAHRAGDGEPNLAASFRQRPGFHAERIWHARPGTDASRVARLARQRIHRARLEHQADAPVDAHLRHVSAIEQGARLEERPEQQALQPHEPPPARGRSNSRQPARNQRRIESRFGRPRRFPACARRTFQGRARLDAQF